MDSDTGRQPDNTIDGSPGRSPNPKGGGWTYAAAGVVVLYFIAALEIMIMISPFAFFFYSVFNPILLGFNHWALTRWLTAFFLPHMVIPPTAALMTLRVAGSILFVGGSLIFFICAGQVYLGKLLKWGVASRGCYALVRHPQYTALILAGLGLTILWPRFLTLMFLSVMVFLYYLLAKDEERRMLAHYGDGYRGYIERTGMFGPRLRRTSAARKPVTTGAAIVLLLVLVCGAAVFGFGLRWYTVANLGMKHVDGVDVLTINPADLKAAPGFIRAVRENARGAALLSTMREGPRSRILVYIVPVDYIMQGMIANTGRRWQLFHRHETAGMIVDYVFHPVKHLQRCMMPHGNMPMKHGAAMYKNPTMRRRAIFIQLHSAVPMTSPADDFRINDTRTPRFFADVHLHTDEVLQVRATPPGTGWGAVPTPMF